MRDEFRACNAEALNAYSGDMATRYAALKLAGLEEALAVEPQAAARREVPA